jgi:ribulose-5-phosphate 4-epimerase/fuculose-1-phosphate aldolase
MHGEGYVKFDCRWQQRPPIADERLLALDQVRTQLWDLGLIGFDPVQQVGYGNVSIRSSVCFLCIISGTQTGHLRALGPERYCAIESYSLQENRVSCWGPVRASSETLSHLAVYEALPTAGAVLHVHHARLWRWGLNHLPSSAPCVPYGTPEMAFELMRLVREHPAEEGQIFAMGGHEEGLIAWGSQPETALRLLLGCLRRAGLA